MRLGRVLFSEFRYFKRYAERVMLHNHMRATWKPIAGWKFVGRKQQWYYDENRPWTAAFANNNRPGMGKRPVPVPPIKEWQFFKGDRVEILVGRDKGKQGIINMIVKERNWVFVESLNCKYIQENSVSGNMPICSKMELPLTCSQVRLVDPSDEKGCEMDWRFTEEGERVRVSSRSGRVIPKSSHAYQTEDLVIPAEYNECSKDMTESEVLEVTYSPKLSTFEAEIMGAMGIVEHRKRAKTYWY